MANDPLNRMDEALEREIESALGEMSIEDMLDYADKPREKGSGRESKTGTVVGIHGDDVHVEFGPKSQGICPLGHFAEKPSIGDSLDFIIERFDKNEGLLQLSRRGAVAHAAWDALDVGQTIEARCTGTNKGGLDMEVAGHRAFMPAGQVDLRHIPDLAVFVGEKMPCEIIELDRQRGRVVLSRKQYLVAERAGQREELLASLQEGDDCEATITTLKPYGAFADIGGVDGLIHISDLSWDRIKDPKEVVSVGDTVKVRVLKLDLSGGDQPRISLGMKQLMDDPFTSTSNEFEVGATVSGRVSRIADFGAFVELAPGVDGLIHISELAHERVKNVSSIVKTDEVVTVKIVSLDPGSRRIGLSLKAMTEAPEDGGDFSRADDPAMRKMREQLNAKWGGELRGGL